MVSRFDKLRSQHPALRYRGYSVVRSGDEVTGTFDLYLDPDLHFQPTLSFAAPGVDDLFLAPYLFRIGLVEALSYWKAACPKRMLVECGQLSEEEIEWWRDLFLNGLGEFYFQNNIDPSNPDLVTIEAKGPVITNHGIQRAVRGELVLAAGGKDSSLALELLKGFDPESRREVMILNPTRSALSSVEIAGYSAPVIVRRTIDKKLLELNSQGYLNGHTPFSAYLAFLGTMIADIHGLGSVIVSNERSASEENAVFHGLAVNHQYSKGIRFERLFRSLAAKQFPGSASYYSLIRPLYDLQVSGLFAKVAPQHLKSFRSCNVGQREDRWCGRCPKCAFVCLTIAPFVAPEQRVEIFGGELFQVPEIVRALQELTGLQDHKPFECVGTLGESRDAIVLTLKRYGDLGKSPPQSLVEIAEALSKAGLLPTIDAATATLEAWSEDHELPPHYARSLAQLVHRELV